MTLPAVPVPDIVSALIGDCMPKHVLDAELDSVMAAREVGRFRPLDFDDDRADRERELSRLARANKVLAAYDPGLIVRSGGAR
ncbi:hypothetical protein [Streptomyces pacificus]|nr:hypothetical protein [Streptomyces pacificus]